MKNDIKKIQFRYLFLVTFLLSLIIIGFQIYFLKGQFDNTQRLTSSVLEESLQNAVNKFQVNQLYDGNKQTRESIINVVTGVSSTVYSGLDSLVKTLNVDSLERVLNRDTIIKISNVNFFNESGSYPIDKKSNLGTLIDNFLLFSRNNKFYQEDLMKIDSIYKEIIQEKDIKTAYSIKLINILTDSITAQTSFFNTYKGKWSTSYLYPVSIDKSVQLVYKLPGTTILKKMLGTIIASALMLALLLYFLFYYLYVISRQKKIEKIREDFVHSMTHELRNPLQGALALNNMLQNEKVIENKEMRMEVVSRLKSNLNALKNEVDELLILSLSEKLHTDIPVQIHNVEEMLEELINSCTLISPKPIYFSLEVSPQPCLFSFNLLHLTNAVRNLIENAIKYSGEEVNISIRAIKENNKLSIFVKDDGIGISAKNLPYIFNQYYRIPFSSVPSSVNGFGLGLSYVKWVAETHGGTVTVKSEEHKGSEFTLIIVQN